MHNEDQCQLQKSLQPSPAHLPVQVPGLSSLNAALDSIQLVTLSQIYSHMPHS
jgi:hypothetical protein